MVGAVVEAENENGFEEVLENGFAAGVVVITGAGAPNKLLLVNVNGFTAVLVAVEVGAN